MTDQALKQELARSVPVTIAGKEYQLAFPIRAVIAYKQKTGDSLFLLENWKKIDPEADPERFLACLWAGLQTYQPDVTLDQLGLLVDFSNAVPIAIAIAESLTSYFPKAKEADPQQAATDPAPAETK